MKLTIFYDGHCPLCVAEMNQLRALNTRGYLGFENIYAEGFKERYPQIVPEEADRILHGLTDEGQVLLGLDVTVRAWQLAGKKSWLRILRWPLISWFADHAYLFFARNRYQISYWFTGQARCEICDKDKIR